MSDKETTPAPEPVITVVSVPAPYRMRLFNRMGKIIEEAYVRFPDGINEQADAWRKKYPAMSNAQLVEKEFNKDI